MKAAAAAAAFKKGIHEAGHKWDSVWAANLHRYLPAISADTQTGRPRIEG